MIHSCAHCGNQFVRSRPDQNSQHHCSWMCRWSAKVSIPADVNACWEWTGAIGSHGYGVLNINRKAKTAHRLSVELHGGELGPMIRHTCDNRSCVNPLHLLPGTASDNNRDAFERKRHAWFRWNDKERSAWVQKIVSAQTR